MEKPKRNMLVLKCSVEVGKNNKWSKPFQERVRKEGVVIFSKHFELLKERCLREFKDVAEYIPSIDCWFIVRMALEPFDE